MKWKLAFLINQAPLVLFNYKRTTYNTEINPLQPGNWIRLTFQVKP